MKLTAHSPLLRRLTVSGGLVIAAALAGCGSAPPRPVEEKPAPGIRTSPSPPPTTASTTPAPPPTQPFKPKPGAYYQDDGPADVVPENIDQIPDAEPRPEPLHRFANRPYSVLGMDFSPSTDLKPFKQRGTASWYGRKFHGQKTSTGEPYDMFAMTAAHPTLPLPSYARVTSLATGRTVVVRVNDRGPFHSGRIIDLSYAAAHRIGVAQAGSGPVEVEQIIPGRPPGPAPLSIAQSTPARREPQRAAKPSQDKPAAVASVMAPPATASVLPPLPAAADSPPPPTVLAAAPQALEPATADTKPDAVVERPLPVAAEVAGVYLQLAAFGTRENAENFLRRVQSQLLWLGEVARVALREGLYRVQIGPYADASTARRIGAQIKAGLALTPTLKIIN